MAEFMGKKFWTTVGLSSAALVGVSLLITGCEPAKQEEVKLTKGGATYFYDPDANVCYGALYNKAENAFGVECTPTVMALAGVKPQEVTR